jgi:tetratricopeptide (TPR) repeat protein
VVGTLRFMSPEQALGQRALVDHRADVYSLGATLYELLTLEPALNGRDRQELLRQIALEEPRPPSRLNRAVPAELETVVLKAMAKNPAERYATAQDLADDLRRFLEDKPVRARRPSPRERAVRWARRHKAAVAAAFAGLVIVVAALAFLTFWIRQEMARADTERDRAERRGDRANRARDRARAERARADRQRQRARAANHRKRRERTRAQDNLDLALRAIDGIYFNLGEAILSRQAQVSPADRRRLEKALKFYLAFARQNGTSRAFRFKMGRAYYRVGQIREHLGQYAAAQAAFRQAARICRRLAAEFPGRPDYLWQTAECYTGRGVALDFAGRVKEARRVYRRVLVIAERLAKRFPANARYRSAIGGTLHNLAMLLHDQGKWPQTCAYLEKAIAHTRAALKTNPNHETYRIYLRNHYELLGNTLELMKRLPRAEHFLRQALRLSEELARDAPGTPTTEFDLARSYSNLGTLLRLRKQFREAGDMVGKALTLRERLVETYPGVPEYRKELALSYLSRGELLRQLRRPKEAEAAFREGMGHLQALVKQYPATPGYRQFLALGRDVLTNLLRKTGRPPGGEQALRHDIAVYQRLAREFPAEPHFRQKKAATFDHLTTFLTAAHRPQDALAAARQGREILRRLVKDYPDVPDYREDLANSHFHLGVRLRELDQAARALSCFREAHDLLKKLVNRFPAEPRYQGNQAQCYNEQGLALHALGRPREAVAAYRRAIKLQRRLADEVPRNPDYRCALGGDLCNLAITLKDQGELAAARQLLQEAVGHQLFVLKRRRDHRAARQFLRNHYNVLAEVLVQLEEPAEAAAVYARLIALVKKYPQDSANLDFRLLQIVHDRGKLLFRVRRYPEAEASFREGLTLAAKLVKSFPRVPVYKGNLGSAHYSLAQALRARGRVPEARRHAEKAIRFFREADTALGKNHGYRPALRSGYHLLAELQIRAGDHAGAARSAGELARLFPDSWVDVSRAAGLVARCLPLVAKESRLSKDQRQELARQYTEQVRKLLAAAVKRCPDKTIDQNQLAWDLATAADPLLRDPVRAVELAKRATARATGAENALVWNTLGVAHYYAGDWKAALTALQKSLKYRRGGDSFDWFFLAMAHWKLGERGTARQWFTKAVAWMERKENGKKVTAELRRFRAEAETLLGRKG